MTEKISLFEKALAYLFQPSAGRCRCCGRELGNDDLCESCTKELKQLLLHEPVRGHISKYRHDGLARSMVIDLKLHGKLYFAELIAREISALVPPGTELIVPVPMHISRRLWRGFNQSALIARRLSRITCVPCSQALIRFRRTSSQTHHKSPAERRSNVRGAFRAKKAAPVAGKRVILIDDVVTTGATAEECSKVLLSAGAHSVTVLSYTSAYTS